MVSGEDFSQNATVTVGGLARYGCDCRGPYFLYLSTPTLSAGHLERRLSHRSRSRTQHRDGDAK